jgi:hypothetical protein
VIGSQKCDLTYDPITEPSWSVDGVRRSLRNIAHLLFNGSVFCCYLVSMTFDLMWNQNRRFLSKLHRHVVFLYEWYAYYAELNYKYMWSEIRCFFVLRYFCMLRIIRCSLKVYRISYICILCIFRCSLKKVYRMSYFCMLRIFRCSLKEVCRISMNSLSAQWLCFNFCIVSCRKYEKTNLRYHWVLVIK